MNDPRVEELMKLHNLSFKDACKEARAERYETRADARQTQANVRIGVSFVRLLGRFFK
jgi:hypothetical protein